jgi:Xaa-Pro dipeptidase
MKSPAEIVHMRKAANLTTVGIEAALGEVRLGNNENDVAAAAYAAMVRAGSEHPSQAPFVQAGHRGSWGPHVNWKRSPLTAGEPIVIGLTGAWFRYGAPQYRTAVIGKPDNQTERLADTAIATIATLLDSVRPGRTVDELARTARKELGALGPEIRFDGSLGRSIGLGLVPSWTEGPLEIVEGVERPLEPGMVFHSDVGLRIPGKKGVTFGETWMVTEKGCDVFTAGTRELAVRPL